MIIPTLIDVPVGIDSKGNEVKLHPVFMAYLQQMTQQMQQSLSNEGFVLPPQSDGNVTQLTQSAGGTILYNSTTNKAMVNENGVFKTITTS